MPLLVLMPFCTCFCVSMPLCMDASMYMPLCIYAFMDPILVLSTLKVSIGNMEIDINTKFN